MFSICVNVYKIGLLVIAAKATESPLGNSVEKKRPRQPQTEATKKELKLMFSRRPSYCKYSCKLQCYLV